MTLALTDLLIPTFSQSLRGLSAWLDKAVQHQTTGGAADAVLAMRLADDMYPLSSQVRFCCFQAQEAAFRLSGTALPPELEAVRQEGWSGGERPGSIESAQSRIAEALAALDSIPAGAFDDQADRLVTLDLPNGMIFDLTGKQYARDWSLPQFYFHLTTAYAILRNHGVALGKADYVPHMLTYLRPGTAPKT